MKRILGTTIAATALLGLSWTAQAGTIRAELTTLPTQSVEFTLGGTKPAERPRLEEIARGCPVARSLHPEVQLPMTFVY